jgi:hypothetical protein
MRCQRAWAASSRLWAMARAALREPGPLVTLVLRPPKALVRGPS